MKWLFAGVAARIPARGDYFTLSIGPDPIIVIRGDGGVIHAVANVCRHRGSLICQPGGGNAGVLVCPYHQWVYAPDGRLLQARLMQDTIDKERHGLRTFHTEVLDGLIFICLADAAPDFKEFRDALSPRLRPHQLATAKLAHTATYEIEANWKLVVENSRECYHCGAGHPQYCRAVGFAAAIGSGGLQEQDAAIAAERNRSLVEAGLAVDEIPFEGGDAVGSRWFHYRRFYLRPGWVTESMDGQPVAPLMGDLPGWDTGVFAIVTLPNLLLEANSDYVVTLRIIPVAAARTQAEVNWLVRADATEGIDYDTERLTAFWFAFMRHARGNLGERWRLLSRCGLRGEARKLCNTSTRQPETGPRLRPLSTSWAALPRVKRMRRPPAFISRARSGSTTGMPMRGRNSA